MTQMQLIAVLEKHIPAAAAPQIAAWLHSYDVHLTIKWSRATKLGDYTIPHNGKPHSITINHKLNQFSFLLTLVHELAHLTTHVIHGNRIQPHGAEWKKQFQLLMNHFLEKNIFPNDIEVTIKNYLAQPKASSCADPHLMRVLNTHNKIPETLVEQLPVNTRFSLDDERIFVKGEKRRKNYLCEELITRRKYIVSAVASVRKIHE